MADEDTVLICLPFAGAGPSFFTPWQKRAPEGLRILPVSCRAARSGSRSPRTTRRPRPSTTRTRR